MLCMWSCECFGLKGKVGQWLVVSSVTWDRSRNSDIILYIVHVCVCVFVKTKFSQWAFSAVKARPLLVVQSHQQLVQGHQSSVPICRKGLTSACEQERRVPPCLASTDVRWTLGHMCLGTDDVCCCCWLYTHLPLFVQCPLPSPPLPHNDFAPVTQRKFKIEFFRSNFRHAINNPLFLSWGLLWVVCKYKKKF